MRRNGFTLIELTVVLFILALAAHLGVREMSRVRAVRLRQEADRRLDEIARAVYDETDGVPSGFLADMGRPPLAVDDGAGHLALAELYERPEGVGELRVRPASAANLAEGAPAGIADETVLVPCGWGGPYLRLRPGDTRLRDPWGNPMETPDAAGLARLVATNLADAAAAGETVGGVRHFGSDGMDDAERPPASPEAADAVRAIGAAPAGLLLSFEPGNVAEVRWYAPLGDRITGGAATIPADASQLLLEGLPPGVRFLKVLFSDGTSRIRPVSLRAGRDAVLEL